MPWMPSNGLWVSRLHKTETKQIRQVFGLNSKSDNWSHTKARRSHFETTKAEARRPAFFGFRLWSLGRLDLLQISKFNIRHSALDIRILDNGHTFCSTNRMMKQTFKVENQGVEMVPRVPFCMAYPDVIPDGNEVAKPAKQRALFLNPILVFRNRQGWDERWYVHWHLFVLAQTQSFKSVLPIPT
jgi:hypothetical protein